VFVDALTESAAVIERQPKTRGRRELQRKVYLLAHAGQRDQRRWRR
jgi:hypothetical protein